MEDKRFVWDITAVCSQAVCRDANKCATCASIDASDTTKACSLPSPPMLVSPSSPAPRSVTMLSRSVCHQPPRLFMPLCIIDILVLIAFNSVTNAENIAFSPSLGGGGNCHSKPAHVLCSHGISHLGVM